MPKKEKKAINITARIGETFNKEIEEIKKKRLELGVDKKKKSTRRLTDLIVKHNSWPIIKREMVKIELEK